jgi:hypothetical protein
MIRSDRATITFSLQSGSSQSGGIPQVLLKIPDDVRVPPRVSVTLRYIVSLGVGLGLALEWSVQT